MGDFLFGLLNSFIYLYNMEAKLIKVDNGWILMVDNIIYATDNDKLSLKNCQAIENGYDLDELVKERFGEAFWHDGDKYFKEGFQKALELLGDKKFSEDDVNLAFVLGKNKDESRINKLINSKLQQTEWDCIVEMECVMGCKNLILNGENSVCCGDKKPKFDADGCLILKRK